MGFKRYICIISLLFFLFGGKTYTPIKPIPLKALNLHPEIKV